MSQGQRFELENWSLVFTSDDPYTAPECNPSMLMGARSDGKLVRTSHVVSSAGREVTTYKGTVYVLGEPDSEYVAWLESRGERVDPEQPVKIRRV